MAHILKVIRKQVRRERNHNELLIMECIVSNCKKHYLDVIKMLINIALPLFHDRAKTADGDGKLQVIVVFFE